MEEQIRLQPTQVTSKIDLTPQAHLVTHNDPFNPNDKQIVVVESGSNIKDLLESFTFDTEYYDMVVSRNQFIVDDIDFIVNENDVIEFLLVPKGGGGGGKQMATMVAMIALTAASAGATTGLLGANMANFGALVASGSYLSAGAVLAVQGGMMVAGSMLINAVFKPNFNPAGDYQNSTTYGWDVAGNAIQQGGAVPILYGTHKVVPQYIGKTTYIKDNSQYLRLLLSIGEGKLDSISDIKINDEPISYYDNATYETRLGTNDQTMIQNFNDTWYDKSVNKLINTDTSVWTISQTDGDSVTSLNIGIMFPSGIFHLNDEGNPDNYTVTMQVEYKQSSSSSWIALSDQVYTDKTTSTLRKTVSITGLNPSRYDVRVRYVDTPNTSNRYGSKAYFSYIQEAISDDFTYPNTALLALDILATDQLSGGLPNISCIASRTTSTYGSLDNPAWAALDMLTNNRYGAGVPESRIELDVFQEWATFCSTHNYKINIYIDQQLSLYENLKLIGQIGRANIVQFGSTFSVIIDKPDILPTQGFLFSMGNIIKDSFSETFLPLKDRANIITVSYYDAENDYQKTDLEISQGNYDLVNQVNSTSINLIGCTSKEQAIRQAKYHLNQNRYLTHTVSFDASIDSIHCRVGDIINVAHDVPEWGFSGRIFDQINGTKLVLDRDAQSEMNSGQTYYIQISDSNTDEQILVQISSVDGDIVTLAQNIGDIGELSVYSFGLINRHAKKMRILSISTSGDLKRKISAIEYVEDVYNDNATLINNIYTNDFSIKGLEVSETLILNKDSSVGNKVTLLWRGSSLIYKVSYKRSYDDAYTYIGQTTETSYDIFNLDEGVEYTFKINEATVTHTVLGKTANPDPIESFNVTLSNSVLGIFITNSFVPLDFSSYDLYIENTLVGSYSTKNFTYSVTSNITQNTNIAIKVKDTTGHSSSSVINHLSSIVSPTINSVSHSISNGQALIRWNYSIGSYKLYQYKITSGTEVYTTTDTNILIPLNWLGTRSIKIEAIDEFGNESTSYYDISISAPSAPVISSSASEVNGVHFMWSTPSSTAGIKNYTVVYNGSQIVTTDTFFDVPLSSQDVYSISVYSNDLAGNVSSSAGTKSLTITKPSLYSLNTVMNSNTFTFKWQVTSGTFTTFKYFVSYTDGKNQLIERYVTDNFIEIIPNWIGSKDIYVTPYDVAGNHGLTYQYTFSILNPYQPIVTAEIIGKDALFTIEQKKGSFDISLVEIAYDDVVINASAGTPTWTIPVFWDLTKTFSFTTIDTIGNRSTTAISSVNVLEGSINTITAEIIDNNALLRWTGVNGTLPIDTYKISRGSTYQSSLSDVIGYRRGTFTTIFESQSGDYTYWITPIDTAGNEGVYKSINATISQPPDFILNTVFNCDFSGTKTNIKVADDSKTATLPVNTTQTYQQHFTANSWTTAQNQVSAGYPLWLTPSSGTSSYVQTFDYGTLLPSTTITLTDPTFTLSGSGTYSVTRMISVSTNGSSWTNFAVDLKQVFVTNIRYVKITYNFTVSTNSLLTIDKFKVTLDSKLRSDAGSGSASSSDTGGTTVNFNIDFVDVQSITITPSGTTPLIPVYDFVDIPNPTHFSVYLYNTSGVRVSGNFSWSARGY